MHTSFGDVNYKVTFKTFLDKIPVVLTCMHVQLSKMNSNVCVKYTVEKVGLETCHKYKA